MSEESASSRPNDGSEQTLRKAAGDSGTVERVARVAGRQHGVIGRRQLVTIGLSEDEVDGWLGRGRLHRMHRGVHAVGHLALTPRGHWMAAVLAGGPGTVLSHRTGAALWAIREPGGGRIETTSPRKSRSTDSIHRHFGDLPADETTLRDGIPVTTAARTLLDLGRVAPPYSVESALRQLEFLELRDHLSLPALLARHPRHRGARKVRAALERIREDPGGRLRSPLEELFLPFLDRHALPRPRTNAGVHVPATRDRSERRYEVDCLWQAPRLIVELDGFESHGKRRAFEDDRERDRRLTTAGYRVTRITKRQLLREGEAVAADLSSLLFYKRP